MTVVYIDRVLLLNTLVDYLLLLSTARLAGSPLRRRRFLVCALGGGVYATAVFFQALSWLAHPAAKLLSGFGMAWGAYSREQHPWKLVALFFLLSGGLAGMLLGLGLAMGSPGIYLNRIYASQISWPVLLLSCVIFSVLLHLVFQQGARHGGGEIMKIIVSVGGRSQTIYALYDTGNTLRDPVEGRPVLVLEQRAIKDLLLPQAWDILCAQLQPEEKMARLHQVNTGCRFTLLPFRSVGVSSGLLLAVWSDYIEIHEKHHEKTLIALSPGPVSDGGAYQALWGEEEGRIRHETDAKASTLAQKTRQAG